MVVRTELSQILSSDTLPPELGTRLIGLKTKFANEAIVRDANTGFIWVEFMNKPPYIDGDMLEIQAEAIAFALARTEPTRIIGIPTSGLPLAQQVATLFPDAQFVPARKLAHPEESTSDWPQAAVFDVYSFTKQADMRMVIESIEPGERYLVVDDVAAWGHASTGFIRALIDGGGIPVGFGVGFEKQFQTGIRAVAEAFNIPSVTVVSVTGIQNGEVILA